MRDGRTRTRRPETTFFAVLGLALTLPAGARAQLPSPSPSPISTPTLQIQPITLPPLVTYAWECRGPFEISGAIRQVIVDPANEHTLYAAAENGGAWVLDDDRSTTTGWRPLSDQLDNLQMRGIARSPSDPQFLAVANGAGVVSYSTDQGATWTRAPGAGFQYVRRLLLTESSGLVASTKLDLTTSFGIRRDLWVVSRQGLWRIRFSGTTPSTPVRIFPVSGTLTDALDLAIHPTDPTTMFLGIRGQGVWRSQDTGATWKLVATTAQFGDSSDASACSACGPSTMIKLALNPSRVVAKFGRNVLFSDAGGDSGTWHGCAPVGFRAEDDGGSDIGYRGNYTGQRGDWVHALAIHPTNKNLIYAAQTALFVTTNGGATWTQLSGTHEDIQSLALSPAGDRLYESTDGGVYRRTTPSGPATSLNRDLATLQFFRVGLNGITAVGDADHQGIRGTRDVTADKPAWEFATTGDSGFGNDGLENDHVYADPKLANRFYVAFESRDVLRLRYPRTGTTEDLLPLNQLNAAPHPFIFRTSNNALFNDLNYPVNVFAFDPRTGKNTILLASHEGSTFGIRITHDGNADPHGGPRNDCGDNVGSTFCFDPPLTGTATWTRSFGPVNAPIVSLAFAPQEPGKAYALDESGNVLVKDNVDDDATAWRAVGGFSVGAGDAARQILPDVTTPRKLYAMSHHRVMVSTNDGVSWSPLGGTSLPATQFNCLAQHPDHPAVLYLGTENDVLVSNTGGSAFGTIGATLPNAPVMQLHTKDGFLWAVTFGRGLWRAHLPS